MFFATHLIQQIKLSSLQKTEHYDQILLKRPSLYFIRVSKLCGLEDNANHRMQMSYERMALSLSKRKGCRIGFLFGDAGYINMLAEGKVVALFQMYSFF